MESMSRSPSRGHSAPDSMQQGQGVVGTLEQPFPGEPDGVLMPQSMSTLSNEKAATGKRKKKKSTHSEVEARLMKR